MNEQRKRVVVVGNGMVSHHFCRQLAGTAGWQIVVVGEERLPAYDRVHLSKFFEGGSVGELLLSPASWYEEEGIELHLGKRVSEIHREESQVELDDGTRLPYDELVLASGSSAFVPPGLSTAVGGVLAYRTADDTAAILQAAQSVQQAVVVGGGLLGLEAAKGARDLGLEVTVVEFAPRLMPRQVDEMGGRLLAEKVAGLGVKLRLNTCVEEVIGDPVRAVRLKGGEVLTAQLVIVSAGIRPRDELARMAGLEVGPRGGVVVDDQLRSSDPKISAIGECAAHRGKLYGLVAPGYAMAETLAARLQGEVVAFEGVGESAKLKVLGIEVASVGDGAEAMAEARELQLVDTVRGAYKKVQLSADLSRVLGAVFVGDLSGYGEVVSLFRTGAPPPPELHTLLGFGSVAGGKQARTVCSCNGVSEETIRRAVGGGCESVASVKKSCGAGTGCGGCLPEVALILEEELRRSGKGGKRAICSHFAHTRQELYHLAKLHGVRTFDELKERFGQGGACEVCQPVAASIFASIHGETAVVQDLIQDTNDRFLANIQRGGTYSVVPRIPAGEITPAKLAVIAEVAAEFGLYTKITGAQRIDLFGARKEQLPAIWSRLVAAGMESGHAYGKALRAVKSCVGSTWCRYGLHDSVAFAALIENRYKGLRMPHKLKGGVSGCVRECAEAQGKDFGLVATEKGWNLYVAGNGGARPRHGQLLATDVSEEEAVRLIDRFLLFYITTADKLTRTATWLESLDGGIAYLREVVVEDSLGMAASWEAEMDALVAAYRCEWKEALETPAILRRFASPEGEVPLDELAMVASRGQQAPTSWPAGVAPRRQLPMVKQGNWVELGSLGDFRLGTGTAVNYGGTQIAVFRLEGERWFAIENRCSHKGDLVLSRGLVGEGEEGPRVACPHHKKLFSLETGACLVGDVPAVGSFPVKVDGERVWAELPPVDELRAAVQQHQVEGDCAPTPASAWGRKGPVAA